MNGNVVPGEEGRYMVTITAELTMIGINFGMVNYLVYEKERSWVTPKMTKRFLKSKYGEIQDTIDNSGQLGKLAYKTFCFAEEQKFYRYMLVNKLFETYMTLQYNVAMLSKGVQKFMTKELKP